MRRGRGFGGGVRPPQRPQMNIPRQLQPALPQQQSGGPGPLMTDHLQGLKDIDMELELLKRKREIIEQQQQILSNSYRQRNDYEQPYNESRESRFGDDYTRLYDEPRAGDSYGRGDNSQGRKRSHNVPVWENDTPAKRFSGPSRGAKSLGSRLGPPPSNSRPGPPPSNSRLGPPPNNPRFDFQRSSEPRYPAPRPFKRPPPPRKGNKDFNPTKVSKPSGEPPLKLARYQPAERKRLVTEALEHTGPASKDMDYWLLRADREPHAKLNGRLELALGAIMKDIKAANPQYEHLFKTPLPTRAMKMAVRERIRNVMIGKCVTTIDNIKASYYDMYPCRKQDHVVMQGLEVVKEKKLSVFDSDNAETYFKKNMQYLMNKKMEEMVHQLQLIYGSGGNVPPPKYGRYRSHLFRPNNKKTKPAENQNNPKTDENEDQAQEEKPNEAAEQADKSEPKQDRTEANIEETPTDVEEKPAAVEEKPTAEAEKPTAEEEKPTDPETEKISAEEEAAKNLTLKFINDDQYKALDKLMTYKMLHLLKVYAPEMLKIMDLNKMYRETKAIIISETKKRLEDQVVSQEEDKTAADNTQSTRGKIVPEKRGPAQYYVKILGKPSLPKRKAMEIFFKKYQPRIIKKHKTIHNLLFVGFIDKESYENMLSADGTTIGRFTLDIKISERNTDYKKNGNNSKNSSVATVQEDSQSKLNDSTDIGPDLDDQITNLLSSIRKSEFDNSDDVIMTEPPEPTDDNIAKKENVDAPNIEANDTIDCDADQNGEGDNDVVELKDVPQDKNDVIEVKDDVKTNDVIEIVDEQAKPENGEVINDGNKTETIEDAEKKDEVSELKTSAKEVPKTPTRASARLAVPGGIKTRRMSKLAE